MKKQLFNSFETMSKVQVENLATTVIETLDNHFNQTGRKLFTATDMWFIQRQAKSCVQRRHLI